MTLMRQWLVADRPRGRPLRDGDFRLVEVERPAPLPGEALLRLRWLGFDPAQKGWMENYGGYVAPLEIGDVMRGTGLAEVVESRNEALPVGSLWTGMLGWTEYAVSDGRGLAPVEPRLAPSASLSLLGLTGMTAWVGLTDIGRPVVGDTVLVSGAAGATGSIAGQLAHNAGARVVGIAGGAEKCRWLVETAGFDAAVDYKADDFTTRLADALPGGADVVFDNVGGSVLDRMLGHLARNARVVICGGISRYETGGQPAGPANYFNLVFARARMEGFIVLDQEERFPAIRARLTELALAGKLAWEEDVQHGFENAPATLRRLFDGRNRGKQLLALD